MCCCMQIVAYDFGIKHNILRRLAAFNCRLTVVPADYPAAKVLEMNPDGVFLSNGPVRFFYIHIYSRIFHSNVIISGDE